ncbi:MAG: hypothetical protein ACP5JP_10605, partial [bacterium]
MLLNIQHFNSMIASFKPFVIIILKINQQIIAPGCSYYYPKNAIGKFAHSFNPTIHLRYKDFL